MAISMPSERRRRGGRGTEAGLIGTARRPAQPKAEGAAPSAAKHHRSIGIN